MSLFSKNNDQNQVSENSAINRSNSGIQQNTGDMNIITKDTVIQGSIVTKSNINIQGGIRGDITSSKNVSIGGTVQGDIKGNNVSLSTGKVTGSISSNNDLSLDESAIVVGPLKATNVYSNAKIKGDVVAEDLVELNSESILLGDITAANIHIDPGAVIKGRVDIIRNTVLSGDMFEMEEPFMDLSEFETEE
ncbi:MAG: polymer-forming cytoskeletal protein [Eubacteriaceae bacterium]|nr:polymer-forming cytoskeletal protein [Eubacteriaceae bacterium]